MKVILITAVQNLGKVGDTVEVKNGYAKNFLIPNKKAICFTPNNVKVFESKKDQYEQAHLESLTGASAVKERVAGKDIVIIQNASDDGRLYGSVSTAAIADKINNISGEKSVNRVNIFLKRPIKEIGIHEVRIVLHSDVELNVRVIVSRNESEVESILKSEKKQKASDNKSEVSEVVEEIKEKPKKAKRTKKED